MWILLMIACAVIFVGSMSFIMKISEREDRRMAKEFTKEIERLAGEYLDEERLEKIICDAIDKTSNTKRDKAS